MIIVRLLILVVAVVAVPTFTSAQDLHDLRRVLTSSGSNAVERLRQQQQHGAHLEPRDPARNCQARPKHYQPRPAAWSQDGSPRHR